MLTPPNFISSSLLKSLVITGSLEGFILWEGFVTCWLIIENKAYFGSISGTKVYASTYNQGWLKWLNLSKNGLYHFLSVVFN